MRPRILFGCQPREVLLRRFPFTHGGRALQLGLSVRGGVAAGAHHELARFERCAAICQRVEELAVVAYEDADAVEAPQCAGKLLARCVVDVVGRLVEDERVGALPECCRHLQLLLLAAGQLGVAPWHVVLDAEDAPHLARLAAEVECEVGQPVGFGVGLLGAHDGEQAARDASHIGLDQPAGDLREGGLAAAVVAEQAGPAAREGDGYVVQNGIGGGGVGVAHAGKGYLHGTSLLGGRSRGAAWRRAHQATRTAARRSQSECESGNV